MPCALPFACANVGPGVSPQVAFLAAIKTRRSESMTANRPTVDSHKATKTKVILPRMLAAATRQVLPDDKIFEIIVGVVLSNSGYSQVSEGRLEGRGGWHQTDAFGQYPINIPFVHRIMLLAEAKYYARPVGINIGRDVLARTLDVDQQYRAQDYVSRAEAESQRKTIKGAIFSVSGFTQSTLKFCYSHGIWCVDVPVWMGVSNLRTLVAEIGRLLADRIPARRLTKDEKQLVDVVSSDGYWSLDEEQWENLRKLITGFVMTDSIMAAYANDLSALMVGMLSTSTPIVVRLPSSFSNWLPKTEAHTIEGSASASKNDGNEYLVDVRVHSDGPDNPLVLYVPLDVYQTFSRQNPISAELWYQSNESRPHVEVEIIARVKDEVGNLRPSYFTRRGGEYGPE